MPFRTQALIHVSTAYCNCDRNEVAEEIYPVGREPEQVIALTKWMDDKMVEELTPNLIAGRPNTYTFTKALAERMLLRERGCLPVAIVRPSVVLASYREPVAGWVDNCNGPTGIIAAAGKGFFRYRRRTVMMMMMIIIIIIIHIIILLDNYYITFILHLRIVIRQSTIIHQIVSQCRLQEYVVPREQSSGPSAGRHSDQLNDLRRLENSHAAHR